MESLFKLSRSAHFLGHLLSVLDRACIASFARRSLLLRTRSTSAAFARHGCQATKNLSSTWTSLQAQGPACIILE